MKITIEAEDRVHSSSINSDDCAISEYIDIFYALLICTTFHPETIINGFKEFIEEKEAFN
jgi:hypothetical protein